MGGRVLIKRGNALLRSPRPFFPQLFATLQILSFLDIFIVSALSGFPLLSTPAATAADSNQENYKEKNGQSNNQNQDPAFEKALPPSPALIRTCGAPKNVTIQAAGVSCLQDGTPDTSPVVST